MDGVVHLDVGGKMEEVAIFRPEWFFIAEGKILSDPKAVSLWEGKD